MLLCLMILIDAAPKKEIEPTEVPTPTEIVSTVEPTEAPTPEPTMVPTPTIEPTPEPTPIDITLQYFETNKLYYTVYSELSEWGYSCADPTVQRLTSIHEEKHVEYNGKDYIVHSIASNEKLLPFGSIIWIPKLNKYFICEDNCGMQDVEHDWITHRAWSKGASIWIDIFVATYKHDGKFDYERLERDHLIGSGDGVLEFKLIRYGRN